MHETLCKIRSGKLTEDDTSTRDNLQAFNINEFDDGFDDDDFDCIQHVKMKGKSKTYTTKVVDPIQYMINSGFTHSGSGQSSSKKKNAVESGGGNKKLNKKRRKGKGQIVEEI